MDMSEGGLSTSFADLVLLAVSVDCGRRLLQNRFRANLRPGMDMCVRLQLIFSGRKSGKHIAATACAIGAITAGAGALRFAGIHGPVKIIHNVFTDVSTLSSCLVYGLAFHYPGDLTNVALWSTALAVLGSIGASLYIPFPIQEMLAGVTGTIGAGLIAHRCYTERKRSPRPVVYALAGLGLMMSCAGIGTRGSIGGILRIDLISYVVAGGMYLLTWAYTSMF
ncbi:hypothetical protein PROFUN_10803 [Planoprotostelium fungivorum]|uniref:Transmembrane protein n=1 Tax=Planoprotostelium fungivorum TaxID=1890364 RepID=A0A2P6NCX2_9EUKA|nr:hypothetical protein PROFUN_10803 [Planoprotostelium fungivorum]